MLRKMKESSDSKESYDETRMIVRGMQLWGCFILSKTQITE